MLKVIKNYHLSYRILFTAGLASFLVLTTGCTERGEDAGIVTQVAARINGDEITIHQINRVLQQTPALSDPQAAQERKDKILDRLIDQQLARQKAIEEGLDRSPNVMQAVELAKSEVLARAYLENVANSIPPPQGWEVEKYYSEHPELFAERRLFDVEEFNFMGGNDLTAALEKILTEGQSMTEIANWLRSKRINFVANYGVRTAEQTSLELLPMLQKMQAGEIRMFRLNDGHLRVIRVINFKHEPIDQATATPRIQRFLMNHRAQEVVTRKMNELRKMAKIQYFGEFVRSESGSEPAVTEGTDNDPQGQR